MPPIPHQSPSRLEATKWVEKTEPRSRDKQHFNSRVKDASGLSFTQLPGKPFQQQQNQEHRCSLISLSASGDHA